MIASLTLLAVILFFSIPAAIVLLPYTFLTDNVTPLYATSIWIVLIRWREFMS
jgi:hypothetical protein